MDVYQTSNENNNTNYININQNDLSRLDNVKRSNVGIVFQKQTYIL